MKPADLTLDCPRCHHPCPAWVLFTNRRRSQTTYRVWCEAHGAKDVTL
jgi:hypothetical protein